MDWVFSFISYFSSDMSIYDVSPLKLVNHLMQAFFFSGAICHLVAVLLKIVNFAYAEEVASSRMIQLVGVFLLYYMKIWDYYSGVFYIMSIFAMAMVCLYVCDCCGNISQHLDNWKEQHRDVAIILSYSIMLATTVYIIWQIYINTYNPLEYPYSGIYLLAIMAIVAGNLVRRRSIIYSLLGVFVINYLIAMRHFLHSRESSGVFKAAEVPVEVVLYIIMAVDAEKRERDRIKTDRYKSVFKASVYLMVYSLLNDGQFPLELMFACVFVCLLILGK